MIEVYTERNCSECIQLKKNDRYEAMIVSLTKKYHKNETKKIFDGMTASLKEAKKKKTC